MTARFQASRIKPAVIDRRYSDGLKVQPQNGLELPNLIAFRQDVAEWRGAVDV
jgi:hypothetical protein